EGQLLLIEQLPEAPVDQVLELPVRDARVVEPGAQRLDQLALDPPAHLGQAIRTVGPGKSFGQRGHAQPLPFDRCAPRRANLLRAPSTGTSMKVRASWVTAFATSERTSVRTTGFPRFSDMGTSLLEGIIASALTLTIRSMSATSSATLL